LTVKAAATLVSIAVTPSSPTALEHGAQQFFVATGTYSDGSAANITTMVTWVSSNTAVATISSTTANVNNAMGTGAGTAPSVVAGMATGGAAGTGSTNITASLGGITSPAVTLQAATT